MPPANTADTADTARFSLRTLTTVVVAVITGLVAIGMLVFQGYAWADREHDEQKKVLTDVRAIQAQNTIAIKANAATIETLAGEFTEFMRDLKEERRREMDRLRDQAESRSGS